MAKDGALQFSDIAGKARMLEVRCDRCGRRGRYRVDRLVARFGADGLLFAFTETLIAACPHRRHIDHYQRCAPEMPGLARIVYGDAPRAQDDSHTARLAWGRR